MKATILILSMLVVGAVAPLAGQGKSGKLQDLPGFKRVDTIVVDLDQAGFHPATLRCKPGTVVLKVRNSSGRKNVVFKFDKAGGGALKSQSLTSNDPTYREAVDLAAGEYTLTVTHDKTITLRIIVQ